MIAVQGSIQTRNYDDKNGNRRTAVEIIAEKVSFCGEKKEQTTTRYDAPMETPSIELDEDGLPF